MLGNLVGTFVVILVGVSLIPVIAQELDNAMNCAVGINQTNMTNLTEAPKGSTGSFGGAGGDYQFGGYDGQVKHKSFISKYSVIKTNESMLNPECIPISPSAQTALKLVPLFFGIAIVLTAIMMAYTSLRQVGMV